MSAPKLNCDHRQHKLVTRRARPKGYGDALNVGWTKFGDLVTASHRQFFELRKIQVPGPYDFHIGKPQASCQSSRKTENDTQRTGSCEVTSSDSSEPRDSVNGALPNTENPTQSPEAK